jgi:hypothetical protein
MILPKDTICKHCVFAEYGDTTELSSEPDEKRRRFQIGCHIDLLRKYQKVAEFEVIEEEDIKYFKIKDRLCVGCRLPNWMQEAKNKEGGWKKQLENEMAITYTLVIPLTADCNVQHIKDTVAHINEMKNKPIKVIVVKYDSNIRHADLLEECKKITVPWVMEIIFEEKITIERAIDIIAPKTVGVFYSICVPGSKPYDFVDKMYDALRNAHNKFGGNNTEVDMINIDDTIKNDLRVSLVSKIHKFCEEQSCQKMIRKIQEFV